MDALVESPLPVLPVEDPAFWADPNPFLEAARREHPWLARFAQGYVVHGYQAARTLMGDDEHVRSGLPGVVEFYGVRGTMWARFMDEMLLAQNGAEHARLRASVAAAFTPRHANQVRPLMRQVISALLDDYAPAGSFDFAEFAAQFPVAVMCGLLGVSTEAVPQIRKALDDHMASLALDPALKPGFLAAWEVLWAFADRTVSEREASGESDPDHLLDALIAAKTRGELDPTELRFMLLVLMLAGYDTSKNQLTVILHLLLDRPEMYAGCAQDKEYCGKVVEEALRFSPIANTFRLISEDFEYDGFRFHKGEMIAFAPPLAGRDPDAFDDPLTFDPERAPANRHVAFARGAHICLGQYLARAQLEEGLHLIAQRLKNPRRVGEAHWKPFLGAWGLSTLPIAFEPKPADA
jgi:cytochrome P450